MTEPKKPKARFINPPNILKNKVGSGGIAKNILDKAQELLEENNVDFEPIAHTYMEMLRRGLDKAYNPPADADDASLLSGLINPIMQLKANGGMFHYPLVSKISDRMVHFLDNLEKADEDVQEIVQAYQTTIVAILRSELKGDGGTKGDNLYQAICDACERYSQKHKNN